MRRVRLPAGALIAIGPPASGKTTILRGALIGAGLPPHRIASYDEVRARFGNRCVSLACRAVPSSCRHHEREVIDQVERTGQLFTADGAHWLLDATNTTLVGLREQVARAHRAGVPAVALRRAGLNGREFLSLDELVTFNASRRRQVPVTVIETMWSRYVELTEDVLYDLGFDLVVDWDDTTRFELGPVGVDARSVSSAGAVVVGDLHGCARTFLERLLPAVGTDADLSNPDVLVISVGDVHDKGDPGGSVELIRWWLWALGTGRALMVDSNHTRALVRHLTGHDVRLTDALAATLAEIDAQPDAAELRDRIVRVFSHLPSHLWFEDLVVAHAAVTEDVLGDESYKARMFCQHTKGSRTPWEWTGSQTLVHGHDTVEAPTRRRAPARDGVTPGEVINVDTGAHLGGPMSVYLHESGEVIQVAVHPDDVLAPAPADLVFA